MHGDKRNVSVCIFFIQSAILKVNVLHFYDLADGVVIDVDCEAVVLGGIYGHKVQDVVDGVAPAVAGQFGESHVVEPVTLNECRVTFKTSAARAASVYDLGHALRV